MSPPTDWRRPTGWYGCHTSGTARPPASPRTPRRTTGTTSPRCMPGWRPRLQGCRRAPATGGPTRRVVAAAAGTPAPPSSRSKHTPQRHTHTRAHGTPPCPLATSSAGPLRTSSLLCSVQPMVKPVHLSRMPKRSRGDGQLGHSTDHSVAERLQWSMHPQRPCPPPNCLGSERRPRPLNGRVHRLCRTRTSPH